MQEQPRALRNRFTTLEGSQRYGGLQRNLGAPTNILATRLRELEAAAALAGGGQGPGRCAVSGTPGGGARGGTWRDVVARLSGRPVVVPDAEEVVALGAAAQAAAMLTEEPPDSVARRWGTRAGTELDPVERDTEALERHHAVRHGLLELYRS